MTGLILTLSNSAVAVIKVAVRYMQDMKSSNFPAVFLGMDCL